MQLKNAFKEISGFRYIIDTLEIKSQLGQRILLSTQFITNPDKLDEIFQQTTTMIKEYQNPLNKPIFEKVETKLEQIRDLAGTIKNLENKLTLNDIELFEIKNFVLLSTDIKELSVQIEIIGKSIPNLEKIIEILDPEKTKITSFYINNAFSSELGELRKKLISIEFSLESYDEVTDEYKTLHQQSLDIRHKITEIEDQIRTKLSKQLREHLQTLIKTTETVANIDILIAKSKQAITKQFVCPTITQEKTTYNKLFHPELKDILNSQNKKYQPIDIEIHNGTCLITGANMAGKTALLKTIGLSQAMLQFGFFVPAKEAKVALVNKILYSVNDNQSILSGLSSYLAEMININEMVKQARQLPPILLLIDELARTTNPNEGMAIVSAVANHFDKQNVKAIITTHYAGLKTSCRKLRVKGFIEKNDKTNITLSNIGDYIDYSLIQDNGQTVPHEALRIAEIMHFDSEITAEAHRLLNQ